MKICSDSLHRTLALTICGGLALFTMGCNPSETPSTATPEASGSPAAVSSVQSPMPAQSGAPVPASPGVAPSGGAHGPSLPAPPDLPKLHGIVKEVAADHSSFQLTHAQNSYLAVPAGVTVFKPENAAVMSDVRVGDEVDVYVKKSGSTFVAAAVRHVNLGAPRPMPSGKPHMPPGPGGAHMPVGHPPMPPGHASGAPGNAMPPGNASGAPAPPAPSGSPAQ